MMNPEDREYAKNCAICMSRSIGIAALACFIAFGIIALVSFAGMFVFALDLAAGGTMVIGINHVDLSGWTGLLYSLVTAVSMTTLSYSLYNTHLFCKSIEHEQTPFRIENVRTLRHVGYGIIAIALVWGLGTYAIELAFGAPLSNLTAILWVWAGIIILFISYVFEYGCALQEQDDELL